MFLLIDKPRGMTSHDVINLLRQKTGEKRIGHLGTLDPNATGLLILGIGRQSTKRLWEMKVDRKRYLAEIILGQFSKTDDVTGNKIGRSYIGDAPSEEKVKKVLEDFVGEMMQFPPDYSAVKIKGKKAYEIARMGEKPQPKKKKVTIYSIKLVSYKYPIIKIECLVSTGTYMRSLARDIGKKLGTGAYLGSLRRTQVGKYKVEEAVRLDQLSSKNWQDFTFDL